MAFPKVKYFSRKEFDSPDVVGSGENMNPDFIVILDTMRAWCKFPFKINSGYRTPEHNRKIGGAKHSYHVRGLAADIAAPHGDMKWEIAFAAMLCGARGVIVYDNFVHVDYRPESEFPKPVLLRGKY